MADKTDRTETRRLLTERQVEDFLGYARGTLSVLRCRGATVPPYLKIGERAIRYDAAQLDRWLESRTVNPAEAAQSLRQF